MPKSTTVVQQRINPAPAPKVHRDLHTPVRYHVRQEKHVVQNAPGLTVRDNYDYDLEVWLRTLQFCDDLRQCANNILHHERTNLSPLLHYKFKTILDARQFERVANDVQLRIFRRTSAAHFAYLNDTHVGYLGIFVLTRAARFRNARAALRSLNFVA